MADPPACAACRHQRRKCEPGCPLAPYFPADRRDTFLNCHRLFGVKNINRLMADAGPDNRNAFMRSLIFEADARAADPVHGVTGIVRHLWGENQHAQAELGNLQERLAWARQRAAQIGGDAVVPRRLTVGVNVVDNAVMPRQGAAHVQPGLPYAIPVHQQQQPFYGGGGGYAPPAGAGVRIHGDATVGENSMMLMQHAAQQQQLARPLAAQVYAIPVQQQQPFYGGGGGYAPPAGAGVRIDGDATVGDNSVMLMQHAAQQQRARQRAVQEQGAAQDQLARQRAARVQPGDDDAVVPMQHDHDAQGPALAGAPNAGDVPSSSSNQPSDPSPRRFLNRRQ